MKGTPWEPEPGRDEAEVGVRLRIWSEKERNEGPIEEIDEGMEDEQVEDEIMDDNTLMRLGIHEEWYETFGDLSQMCRKPVKSWDSDIKEMKEVLKREGRSAVIELYSPPRVDALARM